MSDKQPPPNFKGFSSGEYFERQEYDPERVARCETGLYRHITKYADTLLVASYHSDTVVSDSPSVVYDSQKRIISRNLIRYNDSSSIGIDGDPLIETHVKLSYHDSLKATIPAIYRIEVIKTQPVNLDEDVSFSYLYQLSSFDDHGFVDAEVTYPDVLHDNYNQRAMTPFDEKNLYDELAIMANYFQLTEGQDDSQLAND